MGGKWIPIELYKLSRHRVKKLITNITSNYVVENKPFLHITLKRNCADIEDF